MQGMPYLVYISIWPQWLMEKSLNIKYSSEAAMVMILYLAKASLSSGYSNLFKIKGVRNLSHRVLKINIHKENIMTNKKDALTI